MRSEMLVPMEPHAFGLIRMVGEVGPPSRAIVDAARRENVVQMAADRDSRKRFPGWVSGSAGDDVNRAAPCPVIVLRVFQS